VGVFLSRELPPFPITPFPASGTHDVWAYSCGGPLPQLTFQTRERIRDPAAVTARILLWQSTIFGSARWSRPLLPPPSASCLTFPRPRFCSKISGLLRIFRALFFGDLSREAYYLTCPRSPPTISAATNSVIATSPFPLALSLSSIYSERSSLHEGMLDRVAASSLFSDRKPQS